MKYVSCRPKFDDVDGAPVANAAWFGKPEPEGAEFIMVHGYNCIADDVRDACQANKTVMEESGIRLAPVCYQWPGLGGFTEKVLFHKAQAQADASAVRLAEYLAAPNAVVMAHSLGAKVVLEAITKQKAVIDTLLLIGAAVAWDCFNSGQPYGEANKNVRRVLVFYSKRDPVLGQAFLLDQFTAALGHDGPTGAPAWVKAIDVTDTVGSHSGYRRDRGIWKRIAQEIAA